MRVVVNHLPEAGRKTGIGYYTAELLRSLRAMTGKQVDLFPDGWLDQVFQAAYRVQTLLTNSTPGPGGSNPSRASWKTRCRRFALEQGRCLKQAVLTRDLQALFHQRRYQLYHETNLIPLPVDAPIVTTLHDLSVVLHPQWHPADRVAYYERHFHQGLRRSQHFLAISEFCRQEIIHTLGIAPERVTRTYMGIRSGLRPLPAAEVSPVLQRLQLPPRYLLYLGTIEPRKNLLTLLRAYVALPDGLRRRWPLVLVGGWGWNTSEVADFYHAQAKHKGVIHLGYVADAHVPALYNGARALVYPSLYEGFGLPPVEMMACGGAVLASTAGAVVETVGAKAHLIDPGDVGGWRHALVRVVTDDDWWHQLRDGAEEVARPFTWEQCARDTLKVYRKLTGQDSDLGKAA